MPSELVCPQCGQTFVHHHACGPSHAIMAHEIAQAPHLYAYAVGAVERKNELEKLVPAQPEEGPCFEDRPHSMHVWQNAVMASYLCKGVPRNGR